MALTGIPTDVTSAAIDAAKNDTRELIAAPGADKQIWVYALAVGGSAAGTALFHDSNDDACTGTMPIAENGGFVLPPSSNLGVPWFKCGTNKALEVTLSADIDLDGVVTYAVVNA